MQDTEITNGNTFVDEVEVNLNMLRALMLNRVGEHVNGVDVVTIYVIPGFLSQNRVLIVCMTQDHLFYTYG
jgi:hypothetical protein